MHHRARIVAGGVSLLIYLVIFLFSSLPASRLPEHLPDYIPHFLEYAALAFFFIQVFRRPAQPEAMAMAFFLVAILGILDEWHQLSVPGRIFSLLDWAYDLAGGLAGMAAFRLLERLSTRSSGGKIARRLEFLLLQR